MAALHVPECGQGDGSGYGDLARYMAGTWSQCRPGLGHRDADLAGLAGITEALARATVALAGQRPGTRTAASLTTSAGCLDAASWRQQAGPAPARQADS